jgi:hypothetical protein
MARPVSFAEAKRDYPARYTLEHVPSWARKRPCDAGGTETRYYAPQFNTDLEWYENTLFPGEGHVSKRSKHCFTSGQTWPLGQWLDTPYS